MPADSNRRRSVRVDVHTPNGHKLTVRARSAYITPRAGKPDEK